MATKRKKRKNHKSNFCRMINCYYNNGRYECTNGNRVESKTKYCIFYTTEGKADE